MATFRRPLLVRYSTDVDWKHLFPSFWEFLYKASLIYEALPGPVSIEYRRRRFFFVSLEHISWRQDRSAVKVKISITLSMMTLTWNQTGVLETPSSSWAIAWHPRLLPQRKSIRAGLIRIHLVHCRSPARPRQPFPYGDLSRDWLQCRDGTEYLCRA